MDLDQWLEEKTFHHSDFSDVAELVRLKREQGVTISLCFPTLNEEKTIGHEIKILKQSLMDQQPLIDEIGIVDSGSTDRTREIARSAGATVFWADDCLQELGPLKGKGENLWKTLYFFNGDIIVWVDADIRNIHPRFVYGLVGPLLTSPEIGYVKAFYRRPIKVGRRMVAGGGRVTELLVRPFLSLLFPDLSMLAQPLSGEYAGRRSLLERVPFFTGYGVEVGLLIDIEQRFGIQTIAQVDMDLRIHRNQDIESLRRMSYAILSVLMTRSEQVGKLALLEGLGHRLHVIKREGNAYLHDVQEVYGKERPPMISVPAYQKRRGILEDDAALIDTGSSDAPPGAVETKYLDESLIALDLAVENRDEALRTLTGMLHERGILKDPEQVAADLARREVQMSTSVGHGVALPHLLTDQVRDPVLAVGRSVHGLEFASPIVRRPVHLVFLILAPENECNRYLEILSGLARLLRHRKVTQALMTAQTPSELISVLKKYETVLRLQNELGIRSLL